MSQKTKIEYIKPLGWFLDYKTNGDWKNYSVSETYHHALDSLNKLRQQEWFKNTK